MGQPVKLSDSLVLDARLTGELTDRSIASQIEFWAGMGRAVESLLRFDQILTLKKRGRDKPLSECLEEVHAAAGKKRLQKTLSQRPYPHYEAVPGKPGLIVRIEENGKHTTGRFVNRHFVASK